MVPSTSFNYHFYLFFTRMLYVAMKRFNVYPTLLNITFKFLNNLFEKKNDKRFRKRVF